MGAPTPPPSNWPAVWAVYAAGLAAGAYMTKVPPALPAMRSELGLSLVEGSFVAIMFNVMGMAVGMLAGVVCDRFGHRRIALGGLAVMTAGGALGAVAVGFAGLLASRFLEGLGFLLFVVSAPAMMTAATANARDRVRALGLWSSYMPTGGSIALLLAPPVIGAWGWRGLWALLALGAAAAAVAFARHVPASRPSETRSLRLIVESLRQPGNIALALLFACYVAQWTSIMVWLPTFLVEHGTSTTTAAAATALMVVANIPGNLAAGWILTKGIARGTLVVTAAALAALCEIGMFADGLPGGLRYAFVLLFSMVSGLLPGSIFSGLPVHAPTPQHIASGSGMAVQTSNIGQFLGPLAIAWIASHAGWDMSLWALLAFAGAAVAGGVAIGRIEKRMGVGARIHP